MRPDRDAQRKPAAMNVGDLAVERHAGGRGEEIDRDQPSKARLIAKAAPDGGQRARQNRVVERSHEHQQQHAKDDEAGVPKAQRLCRARLAWSVHRCWVWCCLIPVFAF